MRDNLLNRVRLAARRHAGVLPDMAADMGVSYSYLRRVFSGRPPYDECHRNAIIARRRGGGYRRRMLGLGRSSTLCPCCDGNGERPVPGQPMVKRLCPRCLGTCSRQVQSGGR